MTRKQFCLRVDDTFLDQLGRASDQTGRSQSQIVREAVRLYAEAVTAGDEQIRTSMRRNVTETADEPAAA